MKQIYTVHANIRKGDCIEIFVREFEEDNAEGDATRKACKIVLERLLEGEDWSLEQLFLFEREGKPVTFDQFDATVMFNFFLEKIREERRVSAHG